MSFDPLIKALEENPALAEELGNAKTPRELDAILDAHGIEKPGPDSQFPEAGGYAGLAHFRSLNIPGGIDINPIV